MQKIFFLLMLFLTACAGYETETGHIAAEPAINNIHGMKVYQQNCVACHGDDGTGAFAGVPDLTRIAGFKSKSDSDAELNQHIEHIKKGLHVKGDPMAMPPKGGNPDLTDQDIIEVLKYMREKFTN